MNLGSSRRGLALMAVVAFVDGLIVASLVLALPLEWLHASNGTLPALRMPIDLLITLSIGSIVAIGLWRWLGSRYDVAAQRAAASGHGPDVGVVEAARRPDTVKTELATTR